MADDRIVDQFAALLEATTGLATSEPNRSHLRRAVRREAAAQGRSPEELLRGCATDKRVLQQVIDAAMIGETYFFRESGQFAYLQRVILPSLLPGRTQVTAWSASCSTGEEAVSLAVVLREAARIHGNPTVRVHATDIRANITDRLSSGRYPESALRRDGSEFHELFRSHYATPAPGHGLSVSRTILDLIQVKTVNLFSDPLENLPDNVDVVFFRNTLIYAPEKNRTKIIERIVSRISPGGYLFLANSELPFVTHPELELVDGDGAYCFVKRSPAALQPAPAGQRATMSANAPKPSANHPADRPSVAEVLAAIETPETAEPTAGHAAALVEALFEELDAERDDHIPVSLDRLRDAGVDDALVRYCMAWAAYSTGDVEQALAAFQSALAADHSLWPAHYYRGRLLESRDRCAARDAYTECIRGIERHPAAAYRFLIGGFEPAQIRSLCVRSIERIDAEHVEYAHGS